MTPLRLAIGLFAVSTLALSGCGGKKSAEFTEVEVVVTINGQPLTNALITFSPTDTTYGPEATSIGTTDDSGRAKMMAGGKSGAAVGANRVTVTDAPTSEELRGDSPEAQQKAAAYAKSLKNRPIPAKYATTSGSDQTVEVKSGTKEYKIDLKR